MSKVSIIIPTYNHAHYLAEAIESILAQTFTDWEAIIVDDGSTDNTDEVVSQFTDPRVHYIRQENAGLAAARNTGIRTAEGEYLAFLDADDKWTPSFLEQSIKALADNQALAGTFSGHYFIDENGTLLPRVVRQTISSEGFRDRLLQGGFFPPCTVLIRTRVVQQVGLFDTNLNGMGTEDWDLWLCVSQQYRMKPIPDPLAYYRVYPASMSTDVESMHACRIAVLTKHFGSLEGEVDQESREKRRAYGFAYRSKALKYVQQGRYEEGWYSLNRAVSTWPSLLERLDTFYELACGDQAKGYRGDAKRLDIEENGAQMLRWLDRFFHEADSDVNSRRSAAYGNAYLALAMLSDQAGQWGEARAYLLQAIGSYPAFLKDAEVIRRLLKLCAGRRVVDWLRRIRT